MERQQLLEAQHANRAQPLTRETMLKGCWTICDDTPTFLSPISELVDWSTNEISPATFDKFLDIIGYSDDEYGARMADEWVGGCLEIDYLACALGCYATWPESVLKWLGEFMALETGGE